MFRYRLRRRARQADAPAPKEAKEPKVADAKVDAAPKAAADGGADKPKKDGGEKKAAPKSKIEQLASDLFIGGCVRSPARAVRAGG